MPYYYSDPTRESDPHALPDVETVTGYAHECRGCGSGSPLFPDYYGLLYLDREECPECGKVGTLRVTDTARKWYYAFGFPGCLWDGDPVGPFDTEAEALADARGEG